MKKILSLLAMAILIIGLSPAAIAGNGQGTQDTATAVNEKYQIGGDREEFVSQAEERIKQLKEKRENALENRNRHRVEVATKRAGLLRKFQENKQELKQVIQKAVQRREQAIEKYREAKQNLEQTKEQLKQCKGKGDVQCTETRKQARKQSHQFLLNAADRVLGLLEKTKQRLQESEEMTEEAKAEATEEIEQRMSEIASVRETIEEMGEDATKDEIKEATGIMKHAWNKSNKEIKSKAGKAAAGKIGGVIVKIEKLETKLERTIEQLQNQGKDTAPIEEAMEKFQNHVSLAKEEHAKAMEKFQSGKANEATQHIRAAHNQIKDAHMILKDAVRKIRKVQQGEAIQEGLEPETEAEEAAEAEAEAAEEAAEATEDLEEEAEAEAEEDAEETEDTEAEE